MRRKKLVPQERNPQKLLKRKSSSSLWTLFFQAENEQKRNDPAFADSYFSSYHRDLKKMTIKI